MPSNILTMDNDFPSFTGEESPRQQIQALHNYLYQLREGLQYSLQNLTSENFNTAAWKDLTDAQKNEAAEQIQKAMNLLSQLSSKVDSLNGRVTAAEETTGKITELEQLIIREGGLQDQIAAMEDTVTGEEGLQKRLEAAVASITGEGGLQERLATIENTVAGEEGLQKRLEAAEASIIGEGGLQARTAAMEELLNTLSLAVKVAEDGSIIIGSKDQRVDLLGEIYINGVLYAQEDMA